MDQIYAYFDVWKDIDRFYFIPLKLDLTYSINGHSISMADKPLYLGSFVRCTLEHPELFTFTCPKCGHHLYPYSFNGSPLSGRVDLEGTCPECGWDGCVTVYSWHIRSKALKATQRADSLRQLRTKLLHPKFKAGTINELLVWLK